MPQINAHNTNLRNMYQPLLRHSRIRNPLMIRPKAHTRALLAGCEHPSRRPRGFYGERGRRQREAVYVSVYVDDIQIYGPKGSKQISELKQDLHKRFAMTDLGPCSYYLGMELQRNRKERTVRITQTTYLKKGLARFNMTDCISAPTPMVVGTQL